MRKALFLFMVPLVCSGCMLIFKDYEDYVLSLIHISEPTRPY